MGKKTKAAGVAVGSAAAGTATAFGSQAAAAAAGGAAAAGMTGGAAAVAPAAMALSHGGHWLARKLRSGYRSVRSGASDEIHRKVEKDVRAETDKKKGYKTETGFWTGRKYRNKKGKRDDVDQQAITDQTLAKLHKMQKQEAQKQAVQDAITNVAIAKKTTRRGSKVGKLKAKLASEQGKAEVAELKNAVKQARSTRKKGKIHWGWGSYSGNAQKAATRVANARIAQKGATESLDEQTKREEDKKVQRQQMIDAARPETQNIPVQDQTLVICTKLLLTGPKALAHFLKLNSSSSDKYRNQLLAIAADIDRAGNGPMDQGNLYTLQEYVEKDLYTKMGGNSEECQKIAMRVKEANLKCYEEVEVVREYVETMQDYFRSVFPPLLFNFICMKWPLENKIEDEGAAYEVMTRLLPELRNVYNSEPWVRLAPEYDLIQKNLVQLARQYNLIEQDTNEDDAGWQPVTDQDGNQYFVNESTGQTSWDNPTRPNEQTPGTTRDRKSVVRERV